jgi:phage major head subunit gpT-like protein
MANHSAKTVVVMADIHIHTGKELTRELLAAAADLDTYSYVIPGMGRAAAQKFDELLLKPL